MSILKASLEQELVATCELQKAFLAKEGKTLEGEMANASARFARMRSALHFMQEEAWEALQYIPRKPWLKQDMEAMLSDKANRIEMLEEAIDIYLFWQAFMCYAGFSSEEIASMIYAKRNKCYNRLNQGAK